MTVKIYTSENKLTLAKRLDHPRRKIKTVDTMMIENKRYYIYKVEDYDTKKRTKKK